MVTQIKLSTFKGQVRATPWTTVLEHKHEPERGDHRTARRRRLGLGPQGTPGRSRRAQRAQRALPDTGGVRAQGTPLPAHDAPAEHVRVPPQGPLGPPAPRGPRVEPRGARAGHNRALRVAQAVPGGEANRAKMGDVHAGHALQGLMDPTVPWGTLGAHLAAAKGARGARVGGGVTVVSLIR